MPTSTAVLLDLRAAVIAAGLVTGCTCDGPRVMLDVGLDARRPEDVAGDGALPLDAPVDTGPDAWEPDAWVPDRLILREIDTTPCAPAVAQPHRPRALPADSTPRVLWMRSYGDLGIEGVTYNAGSVDRSGNLTFDARLITSSVFEVDPAGRLAGMGQGYIVQKGFYGPTMSLVDGTSAEFFLNAIRIDSAPPDAEQTRLLDFRSLSLGGVDFQELAATSDGGFYAQRSSHSALRKYCADGRLQWELLGVERADGMMVEADDSVWLPGSRATENRPLHIDDGGRLMGEMSLPDGGTLNGVGFSFIGDSTVLHALSVDGTTVLVVGRVGDSEAWRFSVPLADFGGIGVDAAGGVWIGGTGSEAGEWQRYVAAGPVAQSPVGLQVGAGVGTPAGEDGSFLTIVDEGPGGPQQVGRLLPDGTLAWTLPISEPFQYMTHDVDGRLYLYGSSHVIAVQTDVLPPSIRGCWQHRCSPRGDNRIEPLP